MLLIIIIIIVVVVIVIVIVKGNEEILTLHIVCTRIANITTFVTTTKQQF